MSERPCLLVLSPHADDEVLGAPGLVLAARDSGWRVVNLLCSLTLAQRSRRRVEVRRATTALGMELRLASEPLLSVSAAQEPARVRELLIAEIGGLVEELLPAIVLSPNPHDIHYAHEAVAAGTRGALETSGADLRWVMWAWWGELPIASTVAGYDNATMSRAQRALTEHAGELERLDLSTALDARARWSAAVGPERIMGPGYRSDRQPAHPFADLLLETRRRTTRWSMAQPRVLTATQALYEPGWNERDLTPWLDAPSASTLLAR